jgi:hypothetical protein
VALYHYNPVPEYVDAVMRYARQMTRDPRTFYAYYNWQVFVLTEHGDLRLTGPGSDTGKVSVCARSRSGNPWNIPSLWPQPRTNPRSVRRYAFSSDRPDPETPRSTGATRWL